MVKTTFNGEVAMGLIWDILSAPVLGIPKAVKWLGEKVDEVVQQELSEEENKLKGELIACQMKIEMGDISQEEYDKKENEILERIRQLNER